MDTTTTEQAKAAPDAAPTPTDAPVQPPATAVDTNAPVITPEARLEQLLAAKAAAEKESAEPEPPAAEPEVTDPEAAPATPEPETETESEAETEPEQPPAKAEKEVDRFRFKSAEDRAVAMIAKTKGISLVEAANIYAGTPPAPTEPAPQPQAVSQPEPDSDLAELEAKLASIDQREDEESEAAGVKSLVEIRRERDAVKQQIDALKHQIHQSAAQAAAQHKAAVNAAIDRAGTMFPDARDPGSELGQSIAALIKEIRSTPGHPNAAILSTADAAMFLTQTAASKLAAIKAEENGTDYGSEYAKLTASKKAPAQPPKTQVATPQPKKPVLAGASASTPPPVSPPAKPLTRLDLANMSLEELKALRPQSPAFILRT